MNKFLVYIQLIPSWVFLLSTVTLVTVLFTLFIIHKNKLHKLIQTFQSQLDGHELIIDEFKASQLNQQASQDEKQQQHDALQLENKQVSQQLEHRIKLLQTKLEAQQALINQNQSQLPEDKLYSRAQKMVLLGADVEELVVECELPKAEAEMLVALHHKKK